MKDVSELRQDPVSGEWVIIATGRAKRPDEFAALTQVEKTTPVESCPFESPELTGNTVVGHIPGLSDPADWWIKIIENKFPIVEGDKCGVIVEEGPYKIQSGAGHHRVVITRDHVRSIGQMTQKEAEVVVSAYQAQYRELAALDCSRYILVFHNHGHSAGASISHPHSQIIAIPIIPGDVGRSLSGAEKYYNEHKGCIHCATLDWELEDKKRIIFENEHTVVIAPYTPRSAFELRIYPLKHSSYFEDMTSSEINSVAESLRISLAKLFKGLNNIPYNFFIHTSPVYERERYDYYHWHIEVLPKAPTPPAGFELGTDIDVSPVNPDEAAQFLRGIVVDKN